MIHNVFHRSASCRINEERKLWQWNFEVFVADVESNLTRQLTFILAVEIGENRY